MSPEVSIAREVIVCSPDVGDRSRCQERQAVIKASLRPGAIVNLRLTGRDRLRTPSLASYLIAPILLHDPRWRRLRHAANRGLPDDRLALGSR